MLGGGGRYGGVGVLLLQVVESSSVGLVVEALSRLPPPYLEGQQPPDNQDAAYSGGVLVEAFVGTWSAANMAMLAAHVAKASAPWLRLRKVLMPSLHAELRDVCFQALLLTDWQATASAPACDLRAAPDSVLKLGAGGLASHLSPFALVAAHGIMPEDAEAWRTALTHTTVREGGRQAGTHERMDGRTD